uniref:Cytochrome P450 monooxygenase CYP333B27 n=1 Tax=Cnaphalocrocis medinalis TaxID=437488 RepID=A0A0C5C533_CNAME|nr:cytochrome P450 monooxygenase CYP333B27 [Cnaphalocrocis medinalis]
MKSSRLTPVFCLETYQKIYARCLSANAATAPRNSQKLKSYSEIPGPSSLPIIGQTRHFLPGGEMYNVSALKFGEKLYKKYGPIVKFDGSFGRPDFILLFDPESCAQVLRSENWLPIRPGFDSLKYYRRSKVEDPKKPTGLITDQGDVWKQFRSTVNPVMLQPKIVQQYRDMLDEVARDMILRMKSIRDDKNMLKGKFDVEMNLWALESIGLVALGRRLNCFDPNLPEDSPVKKLIQVVHDTFVTANELDFKPSLWKYYKTRTFKKAMKLYESHANIARHFIDITINELEKNSGNARKSDDEKSVLEKLLDINKEVALIMASDMLFAGVDTTSNTITGSLYLLAKNQEKQDKLREEIASGQEKRPYLKACIKESLRMIPVTPGNLRMTTVDYNILGYAIPKDTQLGIMHQTMSMFENEYPRADEYIPERWMVSKEDPLYHGNAHPFAYSPFGFGVRSCIGRRIAELEMETFLARIIQSFRVEWFGPPIQVIPASLNYITGPYNFVFKDV